ncbi:MAG: hypothetical protein ABL907_23685 [Hyphomicrobium sp.]
MCPIIDDDEFDRKYPSLARSSSKPKPTQRKGRLHLGTTALNEDIYIDDRDRPAHAHTIGTTRSGKSTYLEHLIKQDIANMRGVLLIEPHGGDIISKSAPERLYPKILRHCQDQGYVDLGIVHVIDPQHPSHAAGFNPLAPVPGYSSDTLASAMLEAVEVVWGEDTHEKPATRAVLKATFTALAELGLPLTYATELYKVTDPLGLRAHVLATVKDRYAREIFEDLHERSMRKTRADFDARVEGPKNRLAEFISNATIRSMLDQTSGLVDLLSILDKGHILLVNLQEGGVLPAENARLLGTLLLRRLFMLAPMRQHNIPFGVYIDECHRYLTPDIERLLDEAGKHGISVHLAHQRMGQLHEAGDSILSAVTTCTRVKSIFRLTDITEAADLATRFMPRNYEKPIEVLIRPTVIGNEVLWLNNRSESTSRSEHQAGSEADGVGTSRGRADGEAHGVQQSSSVSATDSTFEATSDSSSLGATSSDSLGQSMLPQTGVFGGTMMPMLPSSPGIMTPGTVGLTLGSANAQSAVDTSGASRGAGQAFTTAESVGSSFARSLVLSQAESFSKVLSKMQGTATSQSTGTGLSETLAPIYKDLPASIHPLPTILDMIGSDIVRLEQGHAFVAIAGEAHRIVVPYTAPPEPSLDRLKADVQAVFAKSPYVTPIDQVNASAQKRWEAFVAAAAASKPKVTLKPEPDSFFEPLPEPPKPPELSRPPVKPATPVKPVKPPKPGKPKLTLVKKSDEPPDDPPPATR